MNAKHILIAIAVLAFCTGVIKYSSWRDAQLTAAMDRYDSCMRATYGMSAAQWYASDRGELPECK